MNPPARQLGNKRDIVILGGGFAGVYCARAISRSLPRGHGLRTTLVAEENHMVFQPMLPEVVGASLSPRHVVNPIRRLCRGVEVFKAEVVSIDYANRTLHLDAGDFTGQVTAEFGHLVIALGASVDISRTPGMAEHAFLLRNVGDAMKLRAAIIGRMEEANIESDPVRKERLTSFVIVGGGYSGVETAGAIQDLIHSVKRFYRNLADAKCSVCLIHSRDHLLPTLVKKMGRYTERELRKAGVDIRLNTRVKSMTAQRILLDDGSVINANTVICTVGNAPHPIVRDLGEQLGIKLNRGRIETAPDCSIDGSDRLWAAGDCAAIPFPGGEGETCPPNAQFAMHQGRLMGRNIAASIAGKNTRPFKFKGLGELAVIGHRKAVADILGVNFSGFFAWWMWRTIYLAKLPGLERKIRVVAEWTLELFFQRDITLLNPRYSTILTETHLDKGDTLFHAGEPAFSFYLIKEGRVDLYDGAACVKTLTTGSHFGERALLDDEIWRFDAVAGSPTTLVAISGRVFDQLVRGSGSIECLFRKSARTYLARPQIEALGRRLSPHLLALKVRDVMNAEVLTFSADASISSVIGEVRRRRHSSFPVVDEHGRFTGLLLKDDLFEFLSDSAAETDASLRRIDLQANPTLSEDETVAIAIESLVRTGCTELIITGGNERLTGILTLMDLLNAEEGVAI